MVGAARHFDDASAAEGAAGVAIREAGAALPRPSPARAAWLLMTIPSVVIALASYRYLARGGPMPPNIAANRFLQPSIIIHATGAGTALLVGPLQFRPGLRTRRPKLHRWLGRIYVAGCVAGGLSGLVLATGASSGPVARTGFFTLGLAWLATTVTATRAAMLRRISTHRRWMIRSFALTLSAVTLRLYLPLSIALHVDFSVAYRCIAWLAWVPNIIAAELYLRRPGRRDDTGDLPTQPRRRRERAVTTRPRRLERCSS